MLKNMLSVLVIEYLFQDLLKSQGSDEFEAHFKMIPSIEIDVRPATVINV